MMNRKRSPEVLAEWARAREHPRTARVRIHIPVTIDTGDRLVAGAIVDLSAAGFRIEADERVSVGQSIRLLRDKQAAGAQILWVEGLEAGGVFTDEQPPQW